MSDATGNSRDSSMTWIFYHFQGEEGEDRSHPNAFKIKHSSGQILCLRDIHKKFPIPEPTNFHFRFRLDSAKSGTYFWLDIVALDETVPLVNGRVICKVLRLQHPPKIGLILRKKRVIPLPSSSMSSSKPYLPPRPREQKPSQPMGDDNNAAFHRSSSSPAFSKGRPIPYSDNVPSIQREEPKSESLPTRLPSKHMGHSSSSDAMKEKSNDSIEDFVSSSLSPKSSQGISVKTDVDLMDGNWNENLSNKKNQVHHFISQMDPLSSTNSPRKDNRSIPISVKQQKTKQFQEGGQTVGPVTLAEMENVGCASADGSNVWNPRFVDKSSKPEFVQRAMEAREREKLANMEHAKAEMRQRDDSSKEMETQKQKSIERLGPKLKSWAEDNGRKKNIRTLLSTMHTVMWEDSKWQDVSMAKLLNAIEVKKYYRKAMLVVHPDKSGGRTADQLVIAERLFDALNSAWGEFAKTEMP